jgi:predicted phosphodiesterase
MSKGRSMSALALEVLSGTRFGLIADAHIHPGKSPAFPDTLREVFRGTDAIITLGDMGERSGLDSLQEIAPIHGVCGVDDPESDQRVTHERRVFTVGGLIVGAVFDCVKHGLFSSADPLVLLPDFPDAIAKVFGRKLDILLCASTHKPCVGFADGTLLINPGSPTLAERRTVALLYLANKLARVELLDLET